MLPSVRSPACWLAPIAAAAIFATAPRPLAGEDLLLHRFQKIQLSDQFWCEGANFADLNNDSHMDAVAGPYWWEGPEFKKRHEFYPAAQTFELKLGPMTRVQVPGFHGALGSENHYADNFFVFPQDFNADKWMDLLIIGFPGKDASWYENPQGREGHWKRHKVFDGVDNESPAWTDIDGDGKPELVCIKDGYYGWASPDWKDPSAAWAFRRASSKGDWGSFTHGLGVGDVNGDGRLDLIEARAWWEQPESLAAGGEWKKHEAAFGSGGAQMYAYDVNGDGQNDIITSLAAHAFGLAWYEQVRENGEIRFKEHIILNKVPADSKYGIKFSEIHAIDLVDMDGDGLKDLVTGKRFWSHGRMGDPDRNNAAVIYWFKLARGAGEGGAKTAEFIPYLIDSDSGVGTQVVAADSNGDGLPDIIVGNKKGTFVHIHRKAAVSKEEWEKAQPKPLAPPGSPGAAGAGGVKQARADLRPEFDRWSLTLRKQGSRGTCSVFTMIGAMEYALARRSDRGEPLSVEYLNWAANQAIGRSGQDGHFFSSLEKGYKQHGICGESEMPYRRKFRAANQPSEKAVLSAHRSAAGGLEFHWIRRNDGTRGASREQLDGVREALVKGWPVCAGASHSVLFVGFEDDPSLEGGGRFLVRDSGGNEEAVSYEAAAQRICDLLWVEPSGPVE